jgi:hypothetical protein
VLASGAGWLLELAREAEEGFSNVETEVGDVDGITPTGAREDCSLRSSSKKDALASAREEECIWGEDTAVIKASSIMISTASIPLNRRLELVMHCTS